MKRYILLLLSLVFIFVLSGIIIAQDEREVELSARVLVAKADAVLNYPNGILKGQLKHIYPTGKSFTVKFKASIGKDDFLFNFSSGGRGDQLKVLYKLSGDDIWVYNIHSLQMFHKIGVDRFDSLFNTNLSYVDMSNSDLQTSYTAKLAGKSLIKGYKCYKVILRPIYDDGLYGHLVLYESVKDFIPLRIDYYDLDGVILKSLTLAKTIIHNKRIFPIRYDMLNIRKGTVSIMTIDDIESDVKFDDKIFRSEKLGG